LFSGYELDGGGSGLWVDDPADDPFAVAAVLVAVGGVDLVVEVAVGVGEGDALSTPRARMWPWWRTWVAGNQPPVRPYMERT
jgi:hypothetical protein